MNWLFVLLFPLHVSFLFLLYLWNVKIPSLFHALFSFFILYRIYSSIFFIIFSTHFLASMQFPPSVDCPPRCALDSFSLYFLLLPRTFPLLSIFPKSCIKAAKLFPKLHVQQALTITSGSSRTTHAYFIIFHDDMKF